MPGETGLKLEDIFKEGWRVITHPIDSPVCSKAEAQFAEALRNPKGIEGSITRIEAAPVRILLAREEVYRRVRMNLTLLLKKKVAFGRSNALVTGSPFQGWIVSSGHNPSGFLMARSTTTHLDSGDFDRLKVEFAVNPNSVIHYRERRDAWTSEYGVHCNGRSPSLSAANFLEGLDEIQS